MVDVNTAPADTGTRAAPAQAPLASVSDLKAQAAQAAEAAKASIAALASEARGKVDEIVDQKKQAGADQLAGIARAAHSAAGDLESNSPAVAKIVHDAASTVDHFAGSLRGADVRDLVASASTFARQQPVAFFAGSVLVGFVLARFLKADAPVAGRAPAPTYRNTPSGGYRSWSSAHPDQTL